MNMILRNILFFLLFAQAALSYPGELTEINWSTKNSIREVLNQFGYKGMTVTEGIKIEDNSGYSIVANCVRNNENYVAKLWVSIDWSEGRVVSVESRKTGERILPNKSLPSLNNEAVREDEWEDIFYALIMMGLFCWFCWKIYKW
jgi:hypothetical protein